MTENRPKGPGWKCWKESEGIHSSVIRVDGDLDKDREKREDQRDTEGTVVIHTGLNF